MLVGDYELRVLGDEVLNARAYVGVRVLHASNGSLYGYCRVHSSSGTVSGEFLVQVLKRNQKI